MIPSDWEEIDRTGECDEERRKERRGETAVLSSCRRNAFVSLPTPLQNFCTLPRAGAVQGNEEGREGSEKERREQNIPCIQTKI